MTHAIPNLTEHVSVRDFKDIPLSAEIKEQLSLAARSASSSHFVQSFSIIEITDMTLRTQLADITESAPYVKQTGAFYVFVADLYRQSTLLTKQGKSLDGLSNMESLLVSIVDTTIAAQNMVVAAEAMELGICYIGGIRNDVEKVADLLNLPKYTLPLFGLTIGIPNSKNKVKPRLLAKNQVSQNSYPTAQFADLSEYDDLSKAYYADRDTNQKTRSWSQQNIAFFQTIRRPEIADFLKKQGFSLT
ncbi:NADPH-dependent oxidoreductase [Pseudolactococcus paracarnosus]|uniref:NADPH-dependent oxidoreductase n=1 Tax=Pseudolactococcus paracarnosus TaxID=2749962 RepID=A0A7L4WET6_9LACT|nr:NADPH-dependent oxidoreductase [Lactococcus paracarnosus]QDJ28747.1 NADPH-dependent oxidoreductase [Lactococcus paracarnosus]